jgi:hypothetical protein
MLASFALALAPYAETASATVLVTMYLHARFLPARSVACRAKIGNLKIRPKIVDARVKPGHDEGWMEGTRPAMTR